MRPPRQVWLHSSDASSPWNFVGGDCDRVVSFDERTNAGLVTDPFGQALLKTNDPFELVDWMESNPRDGSRYVGYLGYGLSRFVERLPNRPIDDLQLPLLMFGRFAVGEPPLRVEPAQDATQLPTITRSFSPERYRATVKRVIEYIAAGDIFQANLSQRFGVNTDASPRSVWQRLIDRSPSSFGALFECDTFSVISNSPELFFCVEPLADGSRRIVNRPIKGTRPRQPGMLEALESSAKDRAELAMIVDLQRNDLGRVCEIGSVRVVNAREIETHPTVYHGAATIDGLLRRNVKLSDILKATFPCGSITGCPKIRAMQIIDELEPVERGPYCGAIGYIDPGGAIEFNVAIRTMTLRNGVAYVPVGGGIVADSDPEDEYAETLTKAMAMFDALGIDGTQVF